VKTDGYPTGPEDGALVLDKAGAAAANESFTHTNLSNWTTYYYAAFAHDVGPNYSLLAQTAATPRPPITVIQTSDFNGGTDGWTLDVWRAGPSSFGTIARDAATGDIVSSGSGASNNRDACTREGSVMTRAISTAGQQAIQVEYDVMALLHAPPGGNPSAGCPVLDGSEEDKLVLFYSTSGTNGPWTIAQVLNEGVELPAGWNRQLVNLAGISSVNNNPNFALRFQWQFNAANDTGRVDNVRVLSGAVTAPGPELRTTPAALECTLSAGQSGRVLVFRVSNSGQGTLPLNVSASVPWLAVSPATGSSAGPEQRFQATFNTAALPPGDHDAVIHVTSASASNSPQALPVRLHLLPAACFAEAFDYYDGHLTLMGGANWSGGATNQLVIDEGVLRIIGGGGLVSAAHPVNCAGSNGLIAAQIKIRHGAGSGDFFWNIAFDDPGGNNLARWYGGSTIARGRVGNTITADLPLTGPGTWDDLYLKLDTAAHTSEFFFNGTSFGIIPHGATSSNTVGAIRFERLDRASAASDDITFDNLTLGAIDRTPPRLDAMRSGGTVVLSWPATGMGAMLQSTPALPTSNPWMTMTNGIVVANGRNTFTAVTTNGMGFYRLRRP
jgi:hypothetical protein